jgi:dienelactone hydrolase
MRRWSDMGDVGEAEKRRDLLYQLLGDRPPRRRPIAFTTVSRETRSYYQLERLILDLNGTEPVPAYFLQPLRSGNGPWPTVLYNHASGEDFVLGKDELLRGRELLQDPPYGEVLTSAGYAVLCADMWAFGERRGRTDTALFKEMLWKGRVLWGMMVYDTLRAVDYLTSRSDVDRTRLATLGLSMGSTMAWWIAALDMRIKVCIDLCCLTDFEALIEFQGLDGHGDYYYVPGLLKHFQTEEINALIAPRPHLSLAGNFDPLTPPKGLDRIDAALKQAYTSVGASEAWQLQRYESGHFETAAMRTEVMAFLEHWL